MDLRRQCVPLCKAFTICWRLATWAPQSANVELVLPTGKLALGGFGDTADHPPAA